jgi:multidrug transporter EmrE-like cation transporter
VCLKCAGEVKELVGLCLVLLWVAIATYGDVCFKTAGGFHSWRFLIGALCYLSTSIIAVTTFNRQQWGWIFIVWSCLALALGIWLSVVLYHEPFTMRRAIAAVLVVVALFLAE